MSTHGINDVSILVNLARCEMKITTNELFELVAGRIISDDDPVNFIKIMNDLRSMKLVEASHNADSLVYWRITEVGRNKLLGSV